MTLYILQREFYTVYRYGGLIVLEHDNGTFTTAVSLIGTSADMERLNRAVWEGQ